MEGIAAGWNIHFEHEGQVYEVREVKSMKALEVLVWEAGMMSFSRRAVVQACFSSLW